MTRATRCLECGNPIAPGRPANVKYCPPCRADRIRVAKARWQSQWRARVRLAFDDEMRRLGDGSEEDQRRDATLDLEEEDRGDA